MASSPSRWLTPYINTVALGGLAILVLAILQFPEDRIGLLIFGGLAVVCQLMDVELFPSSRSRVSVSVIIAIASMVLFGPLAGAFTHMLAGAASAASTTYRSRRTDKGRATLLKRSFFNAGMLAISSGLGGCVYVLLGGTHTQIGQISNILPLVAASTTDVIVNLLLLTGVISLQSGKRTWAIWREDFLWAVPITVGGGTIGGGMLALSYELFTYLGVAVFFLPILAISYSFRLYVKNTKVYMEKLEEVNEQLEEANMRLEKANLGLLETLGAVIDAYDVYTFGHSRQVALYTTTIAEELGLPDEEIARLYKAALVHDIGKVGVLDSIVGKPERLSDEEYNLIKRHPLIAVGILEQNEELRDLIPYVRYHHERWDGGGYPYGLSGEAIPLGARIMSLADSLDAMVSDRPYRPTVSFEQVYEEIQRCSGTQFDPQVVAAFNRVVLKKGRDFFKNSAALVERTMLTSHPVKFTMIKRPVKDQVFRP